MQTCSLSRYRWRCFTCLTSAGISFIPKKRLWKEALCSARLTFLFSAGGKQDDDTYKQGRIETDAADEDYLYDEIGSGLLVRKIRDTKQELLQSLSLYYRVLFLHEDVADLLTEQGE